MRVLPVLAALLVLLLSPALAVKHVPASKGTAAKAIKATTAATARAAAGPSILGDNGLTTYDGRAREPNTLVFGNDMVTEQALQATLQFAKDVLKGNWRPMKNDPATERKEIVIECLNSVAPEPLGWKMWCPGQDAKVVGWQDKSGAAHRQITLRPQSGMTSTMYQWFITTTVLGLMPPIVEFQGNNYHYYHLWHPLDHVESTWALGPTVPVLQKGPPVYVLIHERYRNPPKFPHDRHYETNGWFFVDNAVVNLMKNRYVITMPYMGIPTWTMILEFNDSPEGLIVDVEVIAGVPHKGYDDRASWDGYWAAAGMNELFTAPLLADQRNSVDWEESINAITRHVIEEFSNLQHFVPYLYDRCTLLGKAGLNWVPTYGTWLQNFKGTADSTSVSFHRALEKLAAKQVNRTNSAFGHAVDAKIGFLNKTLLAGWQALTNANEQLSKNTFTPITNKLTKLSYEINKYNGPHPKPGVTVATAKLDPLPLLDALPKISTPKWPKLDVLPVLDALPMLDPSTWPKLDLPNLPRMEVPTLPKLDALPKLDNLPKWEVPTVPKLDPSKWPKLDALPKLELPTLPKLDPSKWPKVQLHVEAPTWPKLDPAKWPKLPKLFKPES